MKTFDEWWMEEIDKCIIPPSPERIAREAWEYVLIANKAPVANVPCSDGLGADADYAYKDIAEFEEIIEYKVNDAFRDGWDMARTTNKQLRALAGEEEGP